MQESLALFHSNIHRNALGYLFDGIYRSYTALKLNSSEVAVSRCSDSVYRVQAAWILNSVSKYSNLAMANFIWWKPERYWQKVLTYLFIICFSQRLKQTSSFQTVFLSILWLTCICFVFSSETYHLFFHNVQQ